MLPKHSDHMGHTAARADLVHDADLSQKGSRAALMLHGSEAASAKGV